ncbi:MAG TPA: PilN domain-containing protein [Casimicrobiaceae bacterium]|nr:PilN domain-containing protein [Casimicrobiaceae bacterium]
MAVIADQTSFKTLPGTRSLGRRLGLTGFGAWWRRELAAALPESVRSFFDARRALPVLAFEGATATLWLPVDANGRRQLAEVGRIGLDGEASVVAAAGRNALAPLARSVGGRPQVVIALSPRTALRKTLTLPSAIEDHLRQAIAYDLDRHTPFKPSELYFDAVVTDRDHVRNTLKVDLAAARRSIVDAALRQAESFGAQVVGITIDPPRLAARSPIDLLPDDRRLPSLRNARWQVLVPAILLAAGVLAALVLPVWQMREEAIALTQATEEARQRAQVSDTLRTDLERRVGDYNFALERKYAFPSTVQVLDDVTRILPDDTWLTQLELHTSRSGKDVLRELTLRGESANAGRLVSLLEDSKIFSQSAPRSPTTKIQPGPGEIFDISTHVKPLPPPTALPLDKGALPPASARGAAASAAKPPAKAPATAAAPASAAPATANPAPGAPATANAPEASVTAPGQAAASLQPGAPASVSRAPPASVPPTTAAGDTATPPKSVTTPTTTAPPAAFGPLPGNPSPSPRGKS